MAMGAQRHTEDLRLKKRILKMNYNLGFNYNSYVRI